MPILVHQVHSNVGYTGLVPIEPGAPPSTDDGKWPQNRQLYAYPVRSFFPENGFITEYAIGTSHIGFRSEFGGVCVRHRHAWVTDRCLVIYQSPRPGPPLPIGEG
jgi:hypothetical protein